MSITDQIRESYPTLSDEVVAQIVADFMSADRAMEERELYGGEEVEDGLS